jgi:hypothetical protein
VSGVCFAPQFPQYTSSGSTLFPQFSQKAMMPTFILSLFLGGGMNLTSRKLYGTLNIIAWKKQKNKLPIEKNKKKFHIWSMHRRK